MFSLLRDFLPLKDAWYIQLRHSLVMNGFNQSSVQVSFPRDAHVSSSICVENLVVNELFLPEFYWTTFRSSNESASCQTCLESLVIKRLLSTQRYRAILVAARQTALTHPFCQTWSQTSHSHHTSDQQCWLLSGNVSSSNISAEFYHYRMIVIRAVLDNPTVSTWMIYYQIFVNNQKIDELLRKQLYQAILVSGKIIFDHKIL